MYDHHNALILVPECPNSQLFRVEQYSETKGLRECFPKYFKSIISYVAAQSNRPDYVIIDSIYVKGVDYSTIDLLEQEYFKMVNKNTFTQIFMIDQTLELQRNVIRMFQNHYRFNNYVFMLDELHTKRE